MDAAGLNLFVPLPGIVAAEVEPVSTPVSGGVGQRTGQSPWGPLEVVALLLLTVGAILLPVIGPLIGLVFVWLSSQWTTRNKVIGTAIVVVLYLLPIVLLLGARSAA